MMQSEKRGIGERESVSGSGAGQTALPAGCGERVTLHGWCRRERPAVDCKGGKAFPWGWGGAPMLLPPAGRKDDLGMLLPQISIELLSRSDSKRPAYSQTRYFFKN